MTLTKAQRQLYGRIGIAVARSRHDVMVMSAPGRRAFMATFERQVREQFPDLSDAEVHRRAGELRRAHMLRLAVASSIARARRKKAASSDDAKLAASKERRSGVTPAETG